jgi:hypothetical protein
MERAHQRLNHIVAAFTAVILALASGQPGRLCNPIYGLLLKLLALCAWDATALRQKVHRMAILFSGIGITAAPIGRRCLVALAIAVFDAAAVLACFRLDVLDVFGGENGLSCPSLGVSQRVCWWLDGHAVPQSILLTTVVIGAVIAFGLYDPWPLIRRLEQSRRPRWWLILNVVGAASFISPYILAAAAVPMSSFSLMTPYLLGIGAAMMGIGLLCWLSDREQLQGTLRPRHVLVAMSIIPATLVAKEVGAELGWGMPVLQTATFKTTAFLLKLL